MGKAGPWPIGELIPNIFPLSPGQPSARSPSGKLPRRQKHGLPGDQQLSHDGSTLFVSHPAQSWSSGQNHPRSPADNRSGYAPQPVRPTPVPVVTTLRAAGWQQCNPLSATAPPGSGQLHLPVPPAPSYDNRTYSPPGMGTITSTATGIAQSLSFRNASGQHSGSQPGTTWLVRNRPQQRTCHTGSATTTAKPAHFSAQVFKPKPVSQQSRQRFRLQPGLQFRLQPSALTVC